MIVIIFTLPGILAGSTMQLNLGTEFKGSHSIRVWGKGQVMRKEFMNKVTFKVVFSLQHYFTGKTGGKEHSQKSKSMVKSLEVEECGGVL
jgi:hypothetical protein